MAAHRSRIALAVLLVFLARARPAAAWETRITRGDLQDFAAAVVTDAAGNVFAAGRTGIDDTSEFTVVKLDAVTGAILWEQVVSTDCNRARALAVDAAGDVIAAGNTLGDCDDLPGLFTVVKLDGATGAERWRAAARAGAAWAVAVDAAGDVVAAGTGAAPDDVYPGNLAVVKLDGTTGAERWRHLAGVGWAAAVALDAEGDAVAAGALEGTTEYDLAVVKLDGTTGAVRWARTLDGSANDHDAARAVAIDAVGDVLAAGITRNTGTEIDFTVVKLAGASGAELWRQALDGTGTLYPFDDEATAVALDASGDVVAAGILDELGTEPDFAVVKLAGGDGTVRWRRTLAGTETGYDAATDLALDQAGDVVAAGWLRNAGSGLDFTVAKLAGADGGTLWRAERRGSGAGTDSALAVALDPAGDVVAAGTVHDDLTDDDFAVVKLDGTTGTDYPCGPLCRLDVFAALVREAPTATIHPATARQLLRRVERIRELVTDAESRHRRQRAARRRQAAQQLRVLALAVRHGVRSGRIDPQLGRRLLDVLAPPVGPPVL